VVESDLSVLPLRKGATLVVGGGSANTIAQRLRHAIRQLKPQLRCEVHTVNEHRDARALTIWVPSWNSQLNRYLDRDQVDGCINAISATEFDYTNATKTTRISLPPFPSAIDEALDQLGY
jgi:hypothetical protein